MPVASLEILFLILTTETLAGAESGGEHSKEMEGGGESFSKSVSNDTVLVTLLTS